jgi:hypothetical protein
MQGVAGFCIALEVKWERQERREGIEYRIVDWTSKMYECFADELCRLYHSMPADDLVSVTASSRTFGGFRREIGCRSKAIVD